MRSDNELEIQEIFNRAQKAHSNKSKLVASLKNRYEKLEEKSEFQLEFLRCLKYVMIVYSREPAVENVIEFVVKFTVSFESAVRDEEEEEDEEEENDASFLNFLLNFLLESHTANSHAVRFRVCQLINMLLGSLSENAQIDDELCERIHEAMLVRVTDKYPNVRIQAALAMARLQDPNDPHCPTIKAYLLLLENDSNTEVRRAVLSCIAPSALTLPKIFRRTRDIKEKVRKLAYQVLAEKVHIRALTIAQRVSLLQDGLNDSSDSVKTVVRECLLPSWLRLLDNDVLQLLHRLDVENCADTAVAALQALFTMATIPDILQDGAKLDDRKLIPVEVLSCENVLYWRALCEFVKSKGDEGEDLLDKLLPEPAIFAEYLYSYLKGVPCLEEDHRADLTQLELVMTKEFIGQQLVRLVGCLDTSEEGGRKRVLSVLQEMLLLPNTPLSLIGGLVQTLMGILRDDQQRITVMAEIISDLREPIVPVTETVDENEKRKKQVKIAELKVCMMECKTEMEECVKREDFVRAAELKESIARLEDQRIQLELEPESDHIKEQRAEKNDPETLLKCLTVCAEVLKQMKISRGICPTISGLIESLILPSVSSPSSAVRNMAVVCLGTAALHSRDLANTHLVLLLQIMQLDEPKIRVSALKALIDQLLLNGLGLLQEKPSEPRDPEDEESPVQNVLKMLSDFLDSEVCELRTEAAEGLAKLMHCDRIVSAKLLSRLILLWYNPLTEEDQRLRHCLGVFLQLYSRESRAHQQCVEESFLMTMRTLFKAPVTSPLSEIDFSNVAELYTELTRPSTLTAPVQGLSVHDSLAVRVCNEILRDIEAPEVRLYCKTLANLELNTEPGSANQELQELLTSILQKVKDKVCVRALEKVLNQLKRNPPSTQSVPQESVLTAVDENGSDTEDLRPKRQKRGVKKSSVKKIDVKDRSDDSDEENVPEVPPVCGRQTRSSKAAVLDKTKQDLSALLSQEATS
ncbi:condensin complex subunit 3 [Hoplias malabaricus]|uniref:condensin complex subunit 3 n=1 Tax=Hoplias malabaricus TaxID=27720 RepID=UPI00346269B6